MYPRFKYEVDLNVLLLDESPIFGALFIHFRRKHPALEHCRYTHAKRCCKSNIFQWNARNNILLKFSCESWGRVKYRRASLLVNLSTSFSLPNQGVRKPRLLVFLFGSFHFRLNIILLAEGCLVIVHRPAAERSLACERWLIEHGCTKNIDLQVAS